MSTPVNQRPSVILPPNFHSSVETDIVFGFFGDDEIVDTQKTMLDDPITPEERVLGWMVVREDLTLSIISYFAERPEKNDILQVVSELKTRVRDEDQNHVDLIQRIISEFFCQLYLTYQDEDLDLFKEVFSSYCSDQKTLIAISLLLSEKRSLMYSEVIFSYSIDLARFRRYDDSFFCVWLEKLSHSKIETKESLISILYVRIFHQNVVERETSFFAYFQTKIRSLFEVYKSLKRESPDCLDRFYNLFQTLESSDKRSFLFELSSNLKQSMLQEENAHFFNIVMWDDIRFWTNELQSFPHSKDKLEYLLQGTKLFLYKLKSEFSHLDINLIDSYQGIDSLRSVFLVVKSLKQIEKKTFLDRIKCNYADAALFYFVMNVQERHDLVCDLKGKLTSFHRLQRSEKSLELEYQSLREALPFIMKWSFSDASDFFSSWTRSIEKPSHQDYFWRFLSDSLNSQDGIIQQSVPYLCCVFTKNQFDALLETHYELLNAMLPYMFLEDLSSQSLFCNSVLTVIRGDRRESKLFWKQFVDSFCEQNFSISWNNWDQGVTLFLENMSSLDPIDRDLYLKDYSEFIENLHPFMIGLKFLVCDSPQLRSHILQVIHLMEKSSFFLSCSGFLASFDVSSYCHLIKQGLTYVDKGSLLVFAQSLRKPHVSNVLEILTSIETNSIKSSLKGFREDLELFEQAITENAISAEDAYSKYAQLNQKLRILASRNNFRKELSETISKKGVTYLEAIVQDWSRLLSQLTLFSTRIESIQLMMSQKFSPDEEDAMLEIWQFLRLDILIKIGYQNFSDLSLLGLVEYSDFACIGFSLTSHQRGCAIKNEIAQFLGTSSLFYSKWVSLLDRKENPKLFNQIANHLYARLTYETTQVEIFSFLEKILALDPTFNSDKESIEKLMEESLQNSIEGVLYRYLHSNDGLESLKNCWERIKNELSCSTLSELMSSITGLDVFSLKSILIEGSENKKMKITSADVEVDV